MDAAQFSALAASRHSIRDFRPDPVPAEVLDSILQDASCAPSWSNTRPYMLALASGEHAERLRAAYVEAWQRSAPLMSKDKIAAVKALATGGLPDGDFKAWKPYPDELRPRSVEVGNGLYGHLGIAREDREGRDALIRRNCEGFGAPVLGFAFARGDFLPWAAMDAGLMLQTLFLSAKAHGVDSCPLGVLSFWRGPVNAEFDIPKDYKLLTGFVLGYASEARINSFTAPRPKIRLIAPKA